MNLYQKLQARGEEGKPIKVGVIGAGKFSAMFLSQALRTPGLHVAAIAELSPEKAMGAALRTGWPEEQLVYGESREAIDAGGAKTVITSSAGALIEADLDVVLEITGVPEAGAEHAVAALEAGKHVVMVNVEADALLGPLLSEKARALGKVYSMAYGDQPALIAEQIDWARASGFEVVCAGKGTRFQPGFHFSTPETVWGHYGFNAEQVASGDYNPQMFNSFLDGTKSAIEMAAVSNACGLTPQSKGLAFPPVGRDDLPEMLKPKADGGILEHSGTVEVVASEHRDGTPVAGDLRWGVYITFRAPTEYVQRCFSEYGVHTDSSGVFTALYRPYHYIGLELGISAASAVLREEPTGSARKFSGDAVSTAKRDLTPGETLDGEGGFTVYGQLASASESLKQSLLPMGLSGGARVLRPVARGKALTYGDVELDTTTLAYRLRKEMEKKASLPEKKETHL